MIVITQQHNIVTRWPLPLYLYLNSPSKTQDNYFCLACSNYSTLHHTLKMKICSMTPLLLDNGKHIIITWISFHSSSPSTSTSFASKQQTWINKTALNGGAAGEMRIIVSGRVCVCVCANCVNLLVYACCCCGRLVVERWWNWWRANANRAQKYSSVHTHTHARTHLAKQWSTFFLWIVNEPRESGQVPKEKIFLRVFSYFIYENY